MANGKVLIMLGRIPFVLSCLIGAEFIDLIATHALRDVRYSSGWGCGLEADQTLAQRREVTARERCLG
jgi:hypothetical protein